MILLLVVKVRTRVVWHISIIHMSIHAFKLTYTHVSIEIQFDVCVYNTDCYIAYSRLT